MWPRYKRAEPTAADHIELKAGETRQVTVDLGAAYDMRDTGMYEVRFRTALTRCSASAATPQRLRIAAVEQVDLVSPSLPVGRSACRPAWRARQRCAAGAPVQWTSGVNAAIGYVSCSSSRQSIFAGRLSQALSYATNASNHLNAGTAGARYTTGSAPTRRATTAR